MSWCFRNIVHEPVDLCNIWSAGFAKKKARGDFPYQLVLPSSGSSKQKSWQKSNPWTPKNQHLETKGVPIFETPTNIAQLIPCNWKAFGSQTGTSRSSYVAQILSGDLLCEYQIRQTHADPPVKKQKKLRHILYYGSVVSIPFPPPKKTMSCLWRVLVFECGKTPSFSESPWEKKHNKHVGDLQLWHAKPLKKHPINLPEENWFNRRSLVLSPMFGK